MAESKQELKSLSMRVKEECDNTCLKLGIPKMKIMDSSAITSWQIEGEKVEAPLFSWTPKSLWTVTAAMKLKDTYSLEGKICPT